MSLPRHHLATAGLAGWLILTVGAFGALTAYHHDAGQAPCAPATWPAATRTLERATLVVAVHPRCACTRATLRELERLVAESRVPLDVRVLCTVPAEGDTRWSADAANVLPAGLPMASITEDLDGREAARFGMETSGSVALYAADGRLVFQGGLTSSRGHEGPSPGGHAIRQFLRDGETSRSEAPVFGCALVGAGEVADA